MARRRSGNGPAAADFGAAEDRLYGAALEDFVALRGELAKALRADGDAVAARVLAARRKPSVALWAVNQLARRFGAEVDVLLAAGDALRVAQAGDPRAFAEVLATERRLVAALGERAASVLEDGGHAASEANLERVRRILQAASGATEEERERLRRGVLAEEIRPAGFDRAFAALGLEEGGGAVRRAESERGAPRERRAKGDVRAAGEGRGESRTVEVRSAANENAAAERPAAGADRRPPVRLVARDDARAAERHLRELQDEAAAVARGLDLQRRHLERADRELKRSHAAIADAERALVSARERATESARARDALVRTLRSAQARHDELAAALASAEARVAADRAADGVDE